MQFDAALNPPIVGIFQVGVAASDMRDNSAVLSTERLGTIHPRCRWLSVEVSV